jgi:hypothetical protein
MGNLASTNDEQSWSPATEDSSAIVDADAMVVDGSLC